MTDCAARWWPHSPAFESDFQQLIFGCALAPDWPLCEKHGCHWGACHCPNPPPEGL